MSDTERVRGAVALAIAGEMREYRIVDDGMEPSMTLLDDGRAALFTTIADRVAAQLGPVGLTAEERTLVEWMRSLFTANPLKHQQHDPVAKQHTDNCVAAAIFLDRLLGVTT